MARNFVMIEGKLTKFGMNKTKTGKVVVNLSVAFSNGGQNDGPGYVNVQCWNTTAPQRKQLKSLESEGRVVVHGSLVQDKWETEDGDKRSAIKINAQSIAVAFELPEEDKFEGKNKGKNKKSFGKKKTFSKKKTRPPVKEVEEEDEEEDDLDEDENEEDLPF